MFIVLEGCDGCGKSTQLDRVSERLLEMDKRFLKTREPSVINDCSAKINNILRSTITDSPTQFFLFLAARCSHIKGLQDAGEKNIICDRFALSTLVYQCLLGDMPIKMYEDIMRYIYKKYKFETPINIVLDVDTPHRRNNHDILARKYKQTDVIKHYRKLAEKLESVELVDGRGSICEVTDRIMKVIGKYI